ncbi:MFS transporter (plasmid) [Burkholderia sp. THE68]|uniref:MFS transporter n=1 Tax=Burkholderia sp. THE68 TaxID=758782 RepID=UPI001318E22B|nr:MFS transporter [Burkholderia sp. THE68]BBU32523.1 MFS transporter [Burkholderia sp. THE68]
MDDLLSKKMLWLLGTCCFTSMATMRVCDSLLPSLQTEFGISTGSAAQTISSFALAYGMMQLFFGPLGDRFGKVKVVSLATLACTVGNVAAAFALGIDQLLAARIISGAAAAGIVPLTMAWIGDTVPYERRQEVLAKLLGATVFGMIAGQWLGAILAQTFSWRFSFGLLGAISLLAGTLVLCDRNERSRPKSDAKKSSGRRATEVLSIPWARTVLFVTFVEGALAFSALSFIPSFLHSAFNTPMAEAGGIVALYGLGGLLYSKWARQLVHRLGESSLAKLGGACLALSYGALALVDGWHWTLPACALAGFGFYALHNTLQTHATQMAPSARGTAVSLFSCCLFFGQSLGVLCASWFVDRFSARPVFIISGCGLLVLAFTFSALITRQTTRLVRT